ncbi:MAG: haloacid dehalogenase-like hydrolase [Holophagales bacterium]|nr:haloacid dehalogenase-like hydrolase [Holophagales bacterium]
MRRTLYPTLALLAGLALPCSAADPLPSWNDGASKKAVVGFVERVTKAGSPAFVPPAERIAVFDNDGTLWSEQPMYVQLAFALDRVKALAPEHPEWKTTEPFAAALAGDLKAVAASGEKGLLDLGTATHAGMTTDEFAAIATAWLAKARHPRFGRPYTEAVYQPMLELLAFLRANGFKTYVVSGGGVEMVRAFSEKVYGIPPEQVVGSTIATEYRVKDGVPSIVRLPRIDFIDDKAGKPVAIQKFIGRRPILAFGNSDGDFQMLEWTTSGPGPRLGLILRHDDAEREYAYDRESHFGRLDEALDAAPKRGWQVVSMKEEWKTVFPAARPGASAASR